MNKLLYRDEKIVIEYNPRSHEDHIMHIGDASFNIQRGILTELSRKNRIEKFKRTLDTIYGINTIEFYLEKESLSIGDLALAFSQARINELEEEVSYFQSKARNVENHII